ncbi:MAG: threonine/serine exporter family protein [Bacillaceae bacterium]|nr:threonine/serine exporter family protein [Bacillaceae bacterium]
MIEQLFTSFIASAGFGIIFNVPKKSLLKCGFVGMIGWLIYLSFTERQFDPVLGTLVASFFVALMSQVFARVEKLPMTIFSVSGIIPLVPGGLAYDTMRHFMMNDYNMALQLAAKVLMISGAIAVGLVFSEVFHQIVRRIRA